MENEFLDKVEDNAVVRIWSEKTQLEKGDSLAKGDETKQLFYYNYGDLPYLFDIKVDEQLFQALAQYCNPAYSCFTFGKVDLVPTMEEYTTLLCCSRFQVDKAYSRAAYVPAFWKKLMNITGMSEQWITARIKQKGECKCIPWKNLRDLILAHPDMKRKVDVFALRVTPILAILAETFRSLNACRQAGEGRFIGCAQLLLAWFHSHFWKMDKISYQVFSENYSPLKEIEEDVEWQAHWLIPDRIFYRCGSFDWVLLLGIWGAIGYAPLLVLRQYSSRQFVLVTHGLAQCEFSYQGYNYKKRVKESSNAWNQARRMKRLAVGSMTTPEYSEWWSKRINDNIPEPNSEDVRPMEEYLQVIPSELEIIKQDFERRNLELEKKIEQLKEEKMHLRLDADVQKLEAEKLKKGKNKAEEDLDSLKTDYKKLCLSMRIAGLGKTSKQWRKEIQEERNKVDWWERKFQEAQVQKETLERRVLETQSHKKELKDRVAELEKSLFQYRNRNSAVELRASLNKIEEMKGKIEELEFTLQNCELRVELLEVNEERWNEQLHLQTLVMQANMLSVKYELESDRGQELALLLRKVKILSIRAKPYL
ncbi:hypothetical protein Gogos_020176 [Gossypium gossypioides]|uniref:DUF7745 domain-containing protein n=1 Tax=Gossypium gossypioides TaxID=34282 RepID=A0A7J9D0Q3_GOSGO|nr:hypothetical protein [Gossypium gossypioides]